MKTIHMINPTAYPIRKGKREYICRICDKPISVKEPSYDGAKPNRRFHLGCATNCNHPDHVKKLHKRAKRGEANNFWAGDSVGYGGVHSWLEREFGKASYCENDITHTAKRFEWANISGQYVRDRSHYKQLCVSCHRRMDKGNFCRYGHEYTKENTHITKQGWRNCRTCGKIKSANLRKKKEMEKI